ncbi:ACR212Cp [Eremothecium gossypii ATCC 10895]|uniref:ACR212Cp n=1 Tax=Eremothecium gossypii (strain ATCC 10895 / CBS 109.51 / FGSC 9923 / NRRL Y-1056) TaxID=284811 RepID=Q75BQ9_EREGS|nr:ACR212Cp [Eremothecium gossypii ATCC 10895]AAS51438.2 ACR212Cp [Eremothecium gossypii ATCC 10895]
MVSRMGPLGSGGQGQGRTGPGLQQAPTVVRNGPMRRAGRGEATREPATNVEYILAAEFDNKLGPVLKHQFPKNLPGFKSTNSNLSNLAGLMIPNGIENRPGESDFTTFILYKDRYAQTFQLFPNDNAKGSLKPTAESHGHLGGSPSSRLESMILEEDENAGSSKTSLSQAREIPLFFINVVHAKIDNANERGAVIKSLAVGTSLQNFFIFKPLLMMALDEYIKMPNIRILIECFNMINSLDLSLMNRIHSNKVLQNILNSINNDEIINEIFDPEEKSLKHILRVNELPKHDVNGNSIVFKQGAMVYRFDSFKPQVLPEHFTKIPLQIDLIKYDAIKLNINYKDHVLKFLRQFIPQISLLDRNDPSWRLMVNSTTLSKDSLCQFVLALSNFINAFDHQHYFQNSSVIIFPYMDISMIDELRNEFSVKKTGNYFSIVGVSNPIFEMQKDVWDFYYDLDSATLLTQAKPSKMNPVTIIGSTNPQNNRSSELLMKIFNKHPTSHVTIKQETPKMGLLLKFIQYIVLQQHDNQTVLNVFKRVIILQLIHLFSRLNHDSGPSIELLLKDEYMLTYKDFIMFPEFFEYSSLKCIRLMHNLETCLQHVFFPKNRSREVRKRVLTQLYGHLKNIYKFMSVNKAHMGRFLNVCLNYPLTHPFETFDLEKSDFSKINLTIALRHEMKHTEALDGLCYAQSNIIDYFSLDKGLSLVFYPLLINPTADTFAASSDPTNSNSVKESPQSNHSRVSTEIRGTSAASNHQSENLSVISSIYENNIDIESAYSMRDDVTTVTCTAQEDLVQLVEKIRRLTIKILLRIERHHIGNMLINKKLNPIFPLTYRTLKKEYFPVSPRRSANDDTVSGAPADLYIAPGTPLSGSAGVTKSEITISPQRKELLQELSLISTAQQDALSVGNKTETTSMQSKLELLQSLTNLELVTVRNTESPDPEVTSGTSSDVAGKA